MASKRQHTTNNPNGRPAGIPNRTTREVRELLQKVIDQELDRIQADLATMDSDKRLDVLLKLLPYCLPKINPIDLESPPDDPKQRDNTIHRLTQRMIANANKAKQEAEQQKDKKPDGLTKTPEQLHRTKPGQPNSSIR
jgi:hypothetical protein